MENLKDWLPDMVGFEATAAAYVADPQLVRLTGVPVYVPSNQKKHMNKLILRQKWHMTQNRTLIGYYRYDIFIDQRNEEIACFIYLYSGINMWKVYRF